MEQRITEKAYAKINLHLDVTGILQDGYHAVSTVMQSVSLYDEITLSNIKKTEGDPCFHLSCNHEGVPCDERNLAVRAALLFCEKTGISLTADIDIVKNIPMAAGMAGGSTDGAAVLRGLNRAMEYPISTDSLCSLGAKLGADVPFCIVGGTMYADGRGDILHNIPSLPDCAIVIACEGEGVSTPWAYRLLDDTFSRFDGSVYTPKSTDGLKVALTEGNISAVATRLYNIFERPVLARRPVAADVKATLEKGGALRAMMSGSGPSVFGIFACQQCAEKARMLLEAKGYKAYICRPI